ncbi:TIGR04282 family arsenosugar biosynthesis glycosyltransferase [Solidesulfovibrio alcoholivorans]|uniref:TIGR04282 family arsenosugar biosynthesis glycosyltransferase n=1 Tax=Solidesulfovibrio alcoholivorans TaxID=81406 RepID=UPI000A49E003|nr:TIGR04282 family arsenosugar biosynthesis glycosyltransferase [Solidesulfovibrio alcoholivorans]
MSADVRLLVLLKVPLAGLVKTRLAASVGAQAALAAYAAMARNVLAAAAASGLPTTIYYAPAGERARMEAFCGPGAQLFPQAGGDLGARMEDAFSRAFAAGAGKTLLVGGDVPLLDGPLLRQGAAALSGAQTVLGPALDGGYYAIGFTRPGFAPQVFADMPWSTSAVCARTRERLALAGRTVALLPELPDCDTADDLGRLARPPWRERLAGTPFGAFLAGASGDPFDRDPDNRLFVP